MQHVTYQNYEHKFKDSLDIGNFLFRFKSRDPPFHPHPSMSPPYKLALHSDDVPGALGEETEFPYSWGGKHKTKATQRVLFTSSD